MQREIVFPLCCVSVMSWKMTSYRALEYSISKVTIYRWIGGESHHFILYLLINQLSAFKHLFYLMFSSRLNKLYQVARCYFNVVICLNHMTWGSGGSTFEQTIMSLVLFPQWSNGMA